MAQKRVKELFCDCREIDKFEWDNQSWAILLGCAAVRKPIRRHKYDQDEVRSIFPFILAAICNDFHLLEKRFQKRKRSKGTQDVINPSFSRLAFFTFSGSLDWLLLNQRFKIELSKSIRISTMWILKCDFVEKWDF